MFPELLRRGPAADEQATDEIWELWFVEGAAVKAREA
jgi:hypothetical protein